MDHPIENRTERIQSLPPELFNLVRNYVFTAVQGEIVNVNKGYNKDYKPPSSLQVSKATRRQFSRSYYGRGPIFECEDFNLLCKYLASLTPLHRGLLQRMRIMTSIPALTVEVSRKEFDSEGWPWQDS